MLVWRGWGIGVLLIAVVVNLLVQTLINQLMGDASYGQSHGWTWLPSLGLAAVAVWFAGVKLDARPGRRVIDAETGQELILKASHDLFWIPFKYWAFPILALGIWFAVSK
jgi:hypothetical protein